MNVQKTSNYRLSLIQARDDIVVFQLCAKIGFHE